jgi:hypothetical protein
MAVWRWQDGATAQAKGPSASALRQHGAIRGVIAFAVASAFWFTHHTNMAIVVAAIGATTLLTALLSPLGLYTRLTRALDVFAQGVGTAITWLILVPIYFLVITPIGTVMGMGSRDPLRRKWTAQTPTFWTNRPATDDAPERRKRPF